LSWAQSANLGIQTTTFSLPISDLSPDTIYYYRCHAQNAGGTTWSASSMAFHTSIVYSLTVYATSGTVRLSPPGEIHNAGAAPWIGRYDVGAQVQLQAEPWMGCLFLLWLGDVPPGAAGDNPLTLTMDSDKITTAVFTTGYRSSRAPFWRMY